MKTYIDELDKKCVVTLTDLKPNDEYGYSKIIDLKPLNNVLKALKYLGKNVNGIYIQHVFFDVDTKYYRRFPYEVIDKLWKKIERFKFEQKVIFKNNRLYIVEDDLEIVCPKSMHDLYNFDEDKTLKVTIKWN